MIEALVMLTLWSLTFYMGVRVFFYVLYLIGKVGEYYVRQNYVRRSVHRSGVHFD